jgi:hypothetical protein
LISSIGGITEGLGAASIEMAQREAPMRSNLNAAFSAGIIAVTLIAGTAFMPTLTFAATDADTAAALKQATADCRAQVKEQAKYNEMSWYARHKAVKNCVKETLAKH